MLSKEAKQPFIPAFRKAAIKNYLKEKQKKAAEKTKKEQNDALSGGSKTAIRDIAEKRKANLDKTNLADDNTSNKQSRKRRQLEDDESNNTSKTSKTSTSKQSMIDRIMTMCYDGSLDGSPELKAKLLGGTMKQIEDALQYTELLDAVNIFGMELKTEVKKEKVNEQKAIENMLKIVDGGDKGSRVKRLKTTDTKMETKPALANSENVASKIVKFVSKAKNQQGIPNIFKPNMSQVKGIKVMERSELRDIQQEKTADVPVPKCFTLSYPMDEEMSEPINTHETYLTNNNNAVPMEWSSYEHKEYLFNRYTQKYEFNPIKWNRF